jgi:hypothetical protein
VRRHFSLQEHNTSVFRGCFIVPTLQQTFMQPVRFDNNFPAAQQLKTSTAAIVYRIMRITAIGNRGLHRICRIFIESGTPYTLTSAIILVAGAFWERKPLSFGWDVVYCIAEDIV